MSQSNPLCILCIYNEFDLRRIYAQQYYAFSLYTKQGYIFLKFIFAFTIQTYKRLMVRPAESESACKLQFILD